jgi:hypothetical protein
MIESISVNQNKINEHSITQGYTKERLGEMAQASFSLTKSWIRSLTWACSSVKSLVA